MTYDYENAAQEAREQHEETQRLNEAEHTATPPSSWEQKFRELFNYSETCPDEPGYTTDLAALKAFIAQEISRAKEEVITLAVDSWHEVAREHDTKPCNCFRANLAAKLTPFVQGEEP